MKKQYELPSFEDYARSNNLSFSSGVSQSFQSAEDNVPISPLSGGTSYAISSSARNKALDFAHPIDSEIIGALDNPVVNTLIGKLVQANYDANYGLTLSTGIHITPNSYPDLYEVIVECANTLNIPVPYVVISNAVSGINACASGTEQFTFIMISSMLPLVMTRDELKFVIGHECGHVALGHVVYHTAGNIIGNAGGLLPFVGQYISKTITYPLRAWGRRSEISADRAGLLCCGSLEVAQKALYKLEAGFLGRMDVNIDEYIKESERMLNSTLIGKYAELSLEHPILPKRMKALSLFANSETYDNCVGNCQSSGSISRERLNKEIEKILEIM